MSGASAKVVTAPSGSWVSTVSPSGAHAAPTSSGYFASVPTSDSASANVALNGPTVKVQVTAATVDGALAGTHRRRRTPSGDDAGASLLFGSGASVSGSGNHTGGADAYAVAVSSSVLQSGNTETTTGNGRDTGPWAGADIVEQVLAFIADAGSRVEHRGARLERPGADRRAPVGFPAEATARPTVPNLDDGGITGAVATAGPGIASGNREVRDFGLSPAVPAVLADAPPGPPPHGLRGGYAAQQPDAGYWAASPAGQRWAPPVAATAPRTVPSGLATVGLLLASALAFVVGTLILVVGAVSRPSLRLLGKA